MTDCPPVELSPQMRDNWPSPRVAADLGEA